MGGGGAMTGPLAYSEPVRLNQVGTGLSRRLEPDAATRAKIARVLDMASLDAFAVDVDLKPVGQGWRLAGHIEARGAQTCGITLEALPITIADDFSIALQEGDPEEDAAIDVDLDDDSPDRIEDGRIDLGQYAVEQLALRLDPFPRKQGAQFVQPPEPVEISPFAALMALKPRGDAGEG